MIQDILQEVQDIDLLVSSCVGVKPDGATADDMCMHLVHRNSKGDIMQYFIMPLDTCNIEFQKSKLYFAEEDEDLTTDIEEEDGKVVGYTQMRRATMGERMAFYSAYVQNRGYYHTMDEMHCLPNCLLPGHPYLELAIYKKPMTIVFKDWTNGKAQL